MTPFAPATPLPIASEFGNDTEAYTASLLAFTTENDLWRILCGGVHILDFLTSTPDLYDTVVPAEWRLWFQLHNIEDVLHLLLREDISKFGTASEKDLPRWRIGARPPESLLDYIRQIRRLSLERDFANSRSVQPENGRLLSQSVAVGMKPKKLHEVVNFARYLDQLASDISQEIDHDVTMVDFGSGQNYLGRALASAPYNYRTVAVESKVGNIKGAKLMDITAKLSKRPRVMRDKKMYRSGVAYGRDATSERPGDRYTSTGNATELDEAVHKEVPENRAADECWARVQYVEHVIQDGDLAPVISQMRENAADIPSQMSGKGDERLLVISLHSCGNLVHHGIRALLLNESVVAIALVGCCYNLMTERLGPPTYKLPTLNASNIQFKGQEVTSDPHGFPMSQRMASYKHKAGEGIRLNITARMMAVQAPQNWTADESKAFFTRHFYRALLQRIFLDHGVIDGPAIGTTDEDPTRRTGATGGQPIIIGSLRKASYVSFVAYVRAAMAKLSNNSVFAPAIARHMADISDDEIQEYERRLSERKKQLSIVWSLMAFSAGVVEALVVVDRWLFLKEHSDEVSDCWVEPVFEYQQSPRNLAVVGVKR
ncbi:MAG: hypothetical protein M1825_001660 [Sarcosagium campestre]|nr:MAG: hypothetical protein M1825_001660 [Sarcosagium campestre]